MHTRLLDLYRYRDEIEAVMSDPKFAASEIEKLEYVLEDIELEMRSIIEAGQFCYRNQA